MSSPFVRFEDGKVALGGKDLLVQSAQLSMAPQLQENRVYGDFDYDIVGAKTENHSRVFSPMGGLSGNLKIKFIITADFFAQNGVLNSIDRLFEIKDGMSEEPIHGNIVGRYMFDHMYLKSLSFSISPLSVIYANAEYNIYGTITRNAPYRFHKASIDPAHGLKSFGEVKASASTADSYSGSQFEVSELTYNILVGRKMHNHIRASEHTSVNTTAHGVLPARVSVENIEVSMSIGTNAVIHNLNPMGDAQAGTTPDGLSDSSVSAYLYSMGGDQIAKFSCVGKIMDQSLSISEGDYSRGQISVKQIIK